jgi:hypothetical protein
MSSLGNTMFTAGGSKLGGASGSSPAAAIAEALNGASGIAAGAECCGTETSTGSSTSSSRTIGGIGGSIT